MRSGNVVVVVLVMLAIIGLAGGMYYFQIQKEAMSAQIATDIPADITPFPTPTPRAMDQGPQIVFENESTINPVDKQMLLERTIQPIIDYYDDLTEGGKIVSITVKDNSGNVPEYPYTVRTVFDNGVELGVAVRVTDGGLDWWVPECMAQCPLSPKFRARYPEIVQKLGY